MFCAAAGPASERAQAACNLIPLAKTGMPSTVASVATPIAAPGTTVDVLVRDCDVSAGFEPVIFDNTITLTFLPPSASPVDVVVDPGTSAVSDCTLSGGRCSLLQFPMPDTTGLEPPYGFAGPARVTVRDSGNAIVAQVDELSLRTNGCDRFPETLFRHFTVLPAPNNVADLRDGVATEMLTTTDGSGSLLIPFDYWGGGAASVLPETPGSPIATLLEGTALIPAQGVGDPQTIFDVITAQAAPSDFVRAFTLDGRPLPPLLRVTQSGTILATADAEFSVLRVAVNDGSGGPNLFDLSDRFQAGVGPIVVTSFSFTQREPIPIAGLRAAEKSIAYSRSELREMSDLNLDGDMDDFVVQIVDAVTGAATNSQSAIAIAGGNAEQYLSELPITVDADGDIISFLESEADQDVDRNADGDKTDLLVRVFDRNGSDLSSGVPASEREAAVELAIGNKPVKVSGDRVFFRGPGGSLDIADNNVGGIVDLTDAATILLSPDDEFLYVQAGAGNVVVLDRDTNSGAFTYVETVASNTSAARGGIALSPGGEHLYVYGSAVLSVYSRDAVTGALTFVEQESQGVNGVDGLLLDGPLIVSPDGAHLYVHGTKAGVPAERSIATFSRNMANGELTYVSSLANTEGGLIHLQTALDMEFDASGQHLYVTGFGRVHFSRNPATGALAVVDQTDYITAAIEAHGFALSPDGRYAYEVLFDPFFDTDALVAMWLRSFRRDPGTGLLSELTNRQQLTTTSGGLREMVIDLKSGRLYLTALPPAGGVIAFETGSGGALLRSPSTVFSASGIERSPGPDDQILLAITSDGRNLIVSVDDEQNAATDSTLISLRAEIELAAFDTELLSMRPTRVGSIKAQVAAERAIVWTQESLQAADLNGDADQTDIVGQLLDVSGPVDSLLSLGVAISDASISATIVAVAVSENGQGQNDFNGDGDSDDNVLAVHTIGGAPSVTNLGVAAEKILAVDGDILFTRPESSEPLSGLHCEDSGVGTCDLNGDGDALDHVMHRYVGADGTIINLGLAVVQAWPLSFFAGEADDQAFLADGRLVAFAVGEAAQGVSLNEDVDLTDVVLHTLDLESGEVASTGTAMDPCVFMVCDPSRHYRVDAKRQTVSFIVFEFQDGNDLDLDGDANDILLVTYNVLSGKRQLIKLMNDTSIGGDRPETPALPDELFANGFTIQQIAETDAGADLNGDGMITSDLVVVLGVDADDDGVLDRFDTCVETQNPDELDQDGDGLGDSRCDPSPAACPTMPRTGCLQLNAGKSRLLLRDNADDGKDQLKWKWSKGSATSLADLGDPVDGLSEYSLCLYDASADPQPTQSAAVLPGGTCDGKPCWKASGTKGFKYKDKQGFPNDINQVKLKPGVEGKPQIQVKGKGLLLDLPSLPRTMPVTVQFVRHTDGAEVCWESTFTSALKNDARLLKANAP